MSSVSPARSRLSPTTRHLRGLAACVPVALAVAGAACVPVALAIASAGCSPAAPASAPKPAGSASESATTAAPDSSAKSTHTIVATVAAAPEKLALDGAVAEWEALAKGSDVAEALDSESVIAVAFRSRDVVVAARLEGDSKDGAILTIGDEAPVLAPIGMVARGGITIEMDCEYEQDPGPEGTIEQGKKKPPEVQAACKAAKARYADMVAKHKARFARSYKIDRDGAHLVGADGKLSDIQGVQSAFKTTPAGVTVEVTLPVLALPRMSSAPVRAIGLAAAVASPTPTLPNPDELQRQDLPEPAEFEPYGALRTFAFSRGGGSPHYAGSLSYQPGEGLAIEAYDYKDHDHMAVKPIAESLFEKMSHLGNIDIGVALFRSSPSLVTMKNGQPIDYIPILGADLPTTDFGPPLQIKGFVERNGQIHAFFYYPRMLTMTAGYIGASWSVLTVDSQGQIGGADVDWDVDDVGSWMEEWGWSSPDLTSFGFRGTTDMPNRGELLNKYVGLEIQFTWDGKAKKYTAKKKRIPTPKRPSDVDPNL
ncbi:MAG: hypothetical protein U0441_21505 [Polyangiaceae bacterium]